TVDFGQTELASGVAMQGDKIVVVGFTCDADFINCQFAVARLLKSGALDTSFDGDGKTTTTFGTGQDFADAVAVKGDRFLAVGEATVDGHSQFASVVYTKNGGLDPKWSGDGKATLDVGSDARGYGGAWGAGDTVVAAGYTCFSCFPGNEFAVGRWTKDGSPDAGFGTTGPGSTQTDVG